MAWAERVDTFAATLEAVGSVVAGVEDGSAPGLGSWDLHSLANHTYRAVATLRTYLASAETGEPTVADAPGYLEAYLATRNADPAGMDAAVAARANEDPIAIAQLATGFAAAASWARTELAATDPFLVIPTRFGSLTVAEYLRTRLLELVVHGLDLANATDRTIALPTAALGDTLAILGELAIRTDRAHDVIRTLSGRNAELSPLIQ